MSKFDEETRKLIESLCDEYVSLRSLEAEVRTAKEGVSEQLKSILGDETEYHTSRAHIVYKEIESSILDGKALRQYEPELFAKFSKTRITRPLKLA